MLTRTQVEKTIGKRFADKLDEPIMKGLGITRRQMVEDLGCANFVAAATLDKVLKRLDINTPAKIFKTSPFDIARTKGIGEAAMFVLMCILDTAQYNVEEWWGWKDNALKFSSFKHNAIRKASKRKHVA